MNIRWLMVLGICLLGISVLGLPLAVGDAVPPVSATDQRGVDFVFTNGTRFLLVATEMASAKSANHKLTEKGAGFLEKYQAAYLMDIHTMPSIARMFALPKLRKYPHRIVLVDSAVTLTNFPSLPGRVTVLTLTSTGHIRKIGYWNPDNEPVADYLE